MRDGAVRVERDWAHGRIGLLLWGLLSVAILASAFGPVAPMTRGTIWALALLWAGAACITNACRSGRLHCYITGPFFVILGVASLLYGAGVLPLGARGWLWIGAVLIMGKALLTIVPKDDTRADTKSAAARPSSPPPGKSGELQPQVTRLPRG